MNTGARVYLSVYGGINSLVWLNSSSTNVKAKAGGHNGRYLEKDDEIKANDLPENFKDKINKQEYLILPWKADVSRPVLADGKIYVLKGQELSRLDKPSEDLFWNSKFVLSSHSDRMGYNLHGPSLNISDKKELVSAPVQFGTIQLLPNGQLMLLMADHQTTGGYPKVAHVISAQHSEIAQLKTGDSVQLRECTQVEAEQLIIKERQHLLQVQNACKFKLEEFFNA